jgi:hypothetical protein
MRKLPKFQNKFSQICFAKTGWMPSLVNPQAGLKDFLKLIGNCWLYWQDAIADKLR